jgi:hypothetical protein
MGLGCRNTDSSGKTAGFYDGAHNYQRDSNTNSGRRQWDNERLQDERVEVENSAK